MRTKLDAGTHPTLHNSVFGGRLSLRSDRQGGGRLLGGKRWRRAERIPKELVLPSWACTELSIKSEEQLDRSSGRAHEGHRQPAEED